MVLMMATMTRRSPAAGRARREDARALLVDGHFHAVDLEVVARHGHAEIAVAFDERRHGVGELLLDHATHGQHLVAHALQVFVEAARDVVRKIGGFHGFLEAQFVSAAMTG